ncbi:MAG: tetratricopeptide repeat protein [Thermomicrobiales bacterium]
MSHLPVGTVTFLVSDLGVDSGGAVSPNERRALLERQGEIVGGAIDAHGAAQFRAEGATLFGAFATAEAALAALVSTCQALAELGEEDDLPRRLRLVLHTTETDVSAGRYLPSSLRHAARLLRAARGGQTLIGASAAGLIRKDLLAGFSLRDLGDHQLGDLIPAERVYQLIGTTGPADQRPIKSLDWHPHNLPTQSTSLIGRDDEQGAVEERLQRPHVRLVTLTGPGGIGKTRLALHVAAGVVDAFDDGVFFVPLDSIADPSQVLPAIARTLNVAAPDAHDLGQALRAYLGERDLLLVVDNVEHVIDAAPEISGLLANCPSVKVLATSREALNVQGEHGYPVPSLELPADDDAATAERIAATAAVRLFVAAAKKANPQFSLTAETAPVVAEICRRLDGLPLAIELAAASINVLTPPHLLEHLDQHLPLPPTGQRGAPARHQTLRETIAWSHDLLSAPEQALFRRLAVFAGSFALDAAEALAEDGRRKADDDDASSAFRFPPSAFVLDGITALVFKSLLRPQPATGSDEDPPRFGMLRTIREFALERLGESGEAEVIWRRHGDWFLALAERADAELLGPGQAEWLARLDADLDDLRAALRWSIEQRDAEPALRLGCALWRYWARRGLLREGEQWLERALELGEQAPPALCAKALNHLGNIANDLDDYARSRQLYEQSLALRQGQEDAVNIAITRLNLGYAAFHQARYVEARQLAEECLSVFRSAQNDVLQASTLHLLGLISLAEGNVTTAWTHHQQAIDIQHVQGDALGAAYSRWRLGVTARTLGNQVQARSLLDEALAVFRDVGDRMGVAYTLHGLADVARANQAYGEAIAYDSQALGHWRETGRKLGTIECLEGIACAAAALDYLVPAAQLFGAASAWRSLLGAPSQPTSQAADDQTIRMIQTALGTAQFDAAWRAGTVLSIDQAAEIASQVADATPASAPSARTASHRSADIGLTSRELEVLCEIAARKSNAEIAETLNISLRTVTTHTQNLFGKLGIHSRTAAAMYAIKHGFC